ARRGPRRPRPSPPRRASDLTAGQPDDPLGPPWVEEMARDFTALGGTGVLALVTLATVGYLLLAGRPHAAALALVAVLGGLLVSRSEEHTSELQSRENLVCRP